MEEKQIQAQAETQRLRKSSPVLIYRMRRKVCRFCKGDFGKKEITYRDVEILKKFLSERGKILPRKMTGTCAKHQRMLARAIKQARILALLPFVAQ